MKNKLFLKYFLMNLSLIIVILASCLADIFFTYQLEKNNVIGQNETMLNESRGELEELLLTISSISSALRSNVSLQALNKYHGDELSTDKYVEMNYLQKELFHVQTIANISGTGFILFRDNPAFVSTAQVADDFGEYYGTYFEVKGKTAEEFKNEIMSFTDYVTCVVYPEVTVFDGRMKQLENPLVVVAKAYTNRIVDKSVAFVFVIDEKELYGKLFTDNQKDNLICISDKYGNVLNYYGEGAEELNQYLNRDIEKDGTFIIQDAQYYLQKTVEEFNRNSIISAIPVRLVQQQTIRLLGVNLSVLLLAVIISILIVILFSYQKSASVQGLLDNINEWAETKYVAGNEYQYIREKVGMIADSRNEYQKALAELRVQMNNNILEQMFVWEITSPKKQELCRKMIPEEIQYFYVLVVLCEEEDAEALLNTFYVLDRMAGEYIGGEYLRAQTAMNEISFLVGVAENELIRKREESNKLAMFLREATKETGNVFHIGVSGIGMELTDIHSCYLQARQALNSYTREHLNTVGYYSDLLNSTGDNLVNIHFVDKLYQYLLSGKEQTFMETLDKLIRHYRVSPYLYEKSMQEICYSIRHTVICAAEELSISETELQMENWNERSGFEERIEELKLAAGHLFAANEKNKRSHNTLLKENIISYIHENYRNPNLSTVMVSENMKISEKYLIQFLKEQTGKTFAKYIEDMRVEKAKELLSETEYSNEQIAGMAGFGSLNSFYRVFHKKTGVSPGTYRKKRGF
ncbi:MAG: helix-turn-helix transcriptional regulator [Lachnospiraceae bacterium]|nr:helix-turn-helix transcriptional regulator [Lachnospiraceae bacterium]